MLHIIYTFDSFILINEKKITKYFTRSLFDPAVGLYYKCVNKRGLK